MRFLMTVHASGNNSHPYEMTIGDIERALCEVGIEAEASDPGETEYSYLVNENGDITSEEEKAFERATGMFAEPASYSEFSGYDLSDGEDSEDWPEARGEIIKMEKGEDFEPADLELCASLLQSYQASPFRDWQDIQAHAEVTKEQAEQFIDAIGAYPSGSGSGGTLTKHGLLSDVDFQCDAQQVAFSMRLVPLVDVKLRNPMSERQWERVEKAVTSHFAL